MAGLTAEAIRKLMPSLEQFLAMKASEEVEGLEDPSAPSPTAEAGSAGATEGGETPGMGVLIQMKPKTGESRGPGGKVPGCPDCEDGTPHEHAK